MTESRRLTLRHFAYCLAVADAASFRGASETLSIAQPAISRAVKEVEEELGYLLFDRTTRSVHIREEAQTFLADARQTINLFDRTVRAAQRLPESKKTGHLVVAYSALAGNDALMQALVRYQEENPTVRVEMHLLSTDNTVRALMNGTADVGFIVSGGDSENLTSLPLWQDELVLLAPADWKHTHLAGKPTALAPESLQSMPFVLGVRENWRSYRLLLDQAFDRLAFEPWVAEEVWDVHVLFRLVADGKGATIYPRSFQAGLSEQITSASIQGLDKTLEISLVWDKTSETQLIRSFCSNMADLFQVRTP